MKNKIKLISLALLVQFNCLEMIHANQQMNLADFPHYQVTSRSEIYPLIEKAYVDIFSSKLNQSLCLATGDFTNISVTLGLSSEKSVEISNLCKVKTKNSFKHFSREYTIVFDPEKKLPFDSWTNLSGMTYLIFDRQVSYEKLKLMLVHELAISIDGKSKLLYTGFLRHQNTFEGMSFDIQDNKVKAFNFAARDDFQHAFATIRATEIEKYLLSQKPPSLVNHNECTSQFKKYLDFIRSNKSTEFVKKPQLNALDYLINRMNDVESEKYNESNYAEHLNMMTDPSIKLDDRHLGRVTFCQYMSYPMFSSNNYYSMFSNGPRPRTGGGWGGGEGDSDSGSDASALVEKDLLKLNTQ